MQTLCLTGIDGCGKSTQAPLLAAALEARGLRVRSVAVWDLLAQAELRSCLAPGGAGPIREYLARVSSPARCLFVAHALWESFQRARDAGGDLLLLVGYWPKYAAVEAGLGTPGALLQDLGSFFPDPDRTLWLDLPVSQAASRREAFTRYECGGREPGVRSFVDFQEGCRGRLEEWAFSRGWIRVEGLGDPEEVTGALLRAWEEGEAP